MRDSWQQGLHPLVGRLQDLDFSMFIGQGIGQDLYDSSLFSAIYLSIYLIYLYIYTYMLLKAVLAFVFLKPVSFRVLVFLVEYELVNVDCIARSSPP